MLIDPDTERYNELFGKLPEKFESQSPPYEVIQDGLLDPSIAPENVDADFVIPGIGARGVLYQQGVADLQSGVRFMLRHVATAYNVGGTDQDRASNGLLSRYIPALEQVTTPASLGATLSEEGVSIALGVTPTTNAAGVVGKVAFGVGMTALSSAGPIGAAAAAIIGFVTAIVSAFTSKKRREAKDRKDRQRALFESFPPLQEQKDRVDDWYVRAVILTIMQQGSWTALFRPRFDPRKEWRGAGRSGGFAFAPGDGVGDEDEFGNKTTLFTSNGGVGFIPGRNEITSVIQVGLDPFGPEIEHWYNTKTASEWPIKQAHVQDVGAFYTNTTRLCAVAWSWVAYQEASPDLYKVFPGKRDAPDESSLHYQWREYCEGGLRFLLGNATDWFNPGDRDKRLYNRDDMSWVFGMAIGCGIGAWRCSYRDGVYHQSPGTYDRFDIRRVYGMNHEIGCVGTPPLVVVKGDGESCYTTMYETTIAPALERLRERQLYFLRHSLVCAYVRRQWDAFLDDDIEDLLSQMRQKLLEHPDRKLIDMADVPRGEMHNGRDWYEQLVEAGAGKSRHVTIIAGVAGTIEPTTEPPPDVPGRDAAMPFSDLGPARATLKLPPYVRPPRSRWKMIATGAGLAALVGAGAYGYYHYNRRLADG